MIIAKQIIYIVLIYLLTIPCYAQKRKCYDVYNKKSKSHIIFTTWDKENEVWKKIKIKDISGRTRNVTDKMEFSFDSCGVDDISPDGKYAFLSMYQIGHVYDYTLKGKDINKPYAGFLDIISAAILSPSQYKYYGGNWKPHFNHIWVYGDKELDVKTGRENTNKN